MQKGVCAVLLCNAPGSKARRVVGAVLLCSAPDSNTEFILLLSGLDMVCEALMQKRQYKGSPLYFAQHRCQLL